MQHSHGFHFMSATKLAIVGVGKIVRDQHLPAIAGNPDFELICTASRHGTVDGVASYGTIEAMLEAVPAIDAVSLCMPPQYRYEAAYAALNAGKHVFLEKAARRHSFGSAGSRAACGFKGPVAVCKLAFALCAGGRGCEGVSGLDEDRQRSCHLEEDVRHWHPNQAWIWQAGGLGVFDPGINALSIITHILPHALFLTKATLEFPENRDAPIAADLHFSDVTQTPVHAEFDWRQTGKQSWDIVAETAAGRMVLSEGARSSRSTAKKNCPSRSGNIRPFTSVSPRSSRQAAPTSISRH